MMSKQNILCVDDQREILSTVKRELSVFEEVFTIVECESAAEAEEVLNELLEENQIVSLIICDHIMPGENGVDFLSRLNQDARFKRIPRILLTGLASHQDTIKAINEAKIDYYLEKPWNSDELVSAVRKLLD